MSAMNHLLRPFLRCTPIQRRFYADLACGNEVKFTLACANKVFYDQAVVKQVDVPSFSGAFGILTKHVPTLAVLKPGVVSVFEESGDVKKIFVSSGTVSINEDSNIQVFAEEAHPLEALDKSAIKNILSQAQDQLSRASSEKDKAEAEIALEVAQALDEAV